MLGRMANLDDYYDTFGDPMFDKGTSFVKINKSAVEPLMAMAELWKNFKKINNLHDLKSSRKSST